MMFISNIFLIFTLFLPLILQVHTHLNDKEAVQQKYDSTEFRPTKYWQIIKEGQSIPPGLHVRVDMQTGLKEAKLMDDTNNKKSKTESQKDLIHVAENNDPELHINKDLEAAKMRMTAAMEQAMAELKQEEEKKVHDQGYISREELEHAMKNFKYTEEDKSTKKENKFRPIEEIKKDFESLNMNIETDFEILSKLMEKYKLDEIDSDLHLSIIEDLEYILHQFDNALNFIQSNGVKYILRDLNNTNDSIRSQVITVIGAASQSNPLVQKAMLENGIVEKLLSMLSMESTHVIKSRILYAIATVIRNFPAGQKVFLNAGGLQPITDCLRNSQSVKVQLKSITLMSDILVEVQDEENIDGFKINKSVWHHYLKEYNWCNFVPDLLLSESHDYREKVLIFMTKLHETCETEFSSAHVKELLNQYNNEYKDLAQLEIADVDSADFYFSSMLRSIEKLQQLLYVMKDEL